MWVYGNLTGLLRANTDSGGWGSWCNETRQVLWNKEELIQRGSPYRHIGNAIRVDVEKPWAPSARWTWII